MTEVEIISAIEPWTILELADGTKVKLRLNVSQVLRDDSVKTPTGDPQYQVRFETSTSIFPSTKKQN